MSKEELIEFLKENLTLEIRIEGGDYGSSTYIKGELKLGEEIISSTTEYLPK